jgi:hypothetical protein
MAWRKAGSTTLGSASGNLEVGSLSSNKFMNIMHHQNRSGSSGSPAGSIRMGNGSVDGNSNYALRKSENGGSDATIVSSAWNDFAGGSLQFLGIAYMINIASEEKLGIYHSVEVGAIQVQEQHLIEGKQFKNGQIQVMKLILIEC